MALILRWGQTWDGTDLTWSETWGSDGTFDLNQLQPVAIAGAVAVQGDVQFVLGQGFDLDPLGAISMAGALAVAGDVGYSIPWEFEPPLSVTTIAGTLGISGDIEFVTAGQFNLQPLGAVAMAGAMQTLGDLQFATPVYFDLAQSGAVALSGALALQGDIQALPAFDLAPLQPVAMVGTVSIAGDVQSVVPVLFDVAPAAPVAVAGSLAVAGDVGFGTTFDLSGGTVALSGELGVAGAIQIRIPATVPDVTGLARDAAVAALAADGFVASVSLVLSTSVPVDQVISQDPAAGTASFVGTTVEIVVSQYDVPKIIGGNKNVRFKPLKRRKTQREDAPPQPAVQAKAKASGLLMGLLARATGLEAPPAPVEDLPPAAADLIEEPPAAVDPPPPLAAQVDAPPEPVDPLAALEQRLLARIAELEDQVAQLRAAAAPMPMDAPRDPINEALQALLPALREPIALEPDAPPAAAAEQTPAETPQTPVEPGPRKLSPEQRRRENIRRAKLLVKQLL